MDTSYIYLTFIAMCYLPAFRVKGKFTLNQKSSIVIFKLNCVYVFVCVDVLRRSQHFFSHVGTPGVGYSDILIHT